MTKFAFFLCSVFFLTSCSSVSYYSSMIHGHAKIINEAVPISDALNSETVSEEVKQALMQLEQVRQFAVDEMLLPDSASYREFVMLDRKYAVWMLYSTEEFSVEAEQWCFLVIGCLNYRGFYEKADAEEFDKHLKIQNKDTYIAGISAYSTLGWFSDPILSSMLYRDETWRANVLMHEMAHQKKVAKDDTAFSEAFASAVANEGVQRWLRKYRDEEALTKYIDEKKVKKRFNQLLISTRTDLKALYNKSISDEEKRSLKQQRFIKLKQDYQRVKQLWQDDRYDKWMMQDLNNAHLSLIATYNELLDGFKVLLERHKNNLNDFYLEVDALMAIPKTQRHLVLKRLAKEQ